MLITQKFFYLFFILLISFCSNAQETKNAETLIVNEWILSSYEINGQSFPPKEKNKNDRMIFFSDKSVQSFNGDNVQKGHWNFDTSSRVLNVVDENNKFDMQLTLISITNSDCVLELENPKGIFVKLHMVSKSK